MADLAVKDASGSYVAVGDYVALIRKYYNNKYKAYKEVGVSPVRVRALNACNMIRVDGSKEWWSCECFILVEPVSTITTYDESFTEANNKYARYFCGCGAGLIRTDRTVYDGRVYECKQCGGGEVIRDS